MAADQASDGEPAKTSLEVAAEASFLLSILLFTIALVMVGGLFLNYNTVNDVPAAEWVIVMAVIGLMAVSCVVTLITNTVGRRRATDRRSTLLGRPSSRRLFMATLGVPYFAYLTALVIAIPAGRYGVGNADLNSFFQGAAPLIGAVLIALVLETPKTRAG
jgi:hypothetical protein